jgi:putative alpha-1,2-mannosidase
MRVVAIVLIAACIALRGQPPLNEVNLLSGTANEGQTVPMIGMPFATTNWVPETRPTEDNCVELDGVLPAGSRNALSMRSARQYFQGDDSPAGGHAFRIEADRQSAANEYVQRQWIDGAPLGASC